MGHWHYTLQVIRDDQQIVCRVIFYDLNAAVFKESKQARPPGDLEGRRPLSLVFPHWVFRSLGLFFFSEGFCEGSSSLPTALCPSQSSYSDDTRAGRVWPTNEII